MVHGCYATYNKTRSILCSVHNINYPFQFPSMRWCTTQGWLLCATSRYPKLYSIVGTISRTSHNIWCRSMCMESKANVCGTRTAWGLLFYLSNNMYWLIRETMVGGWRRPELFLVGWMTNGWLLGVYIVSYVLWLAYTLGWIWLNGWLVR